MPCKHMPLVVFLCPVLGSMGTKGSSEDQVGEHWFSGHSVQWLGIRPMSHAHYWQCIYRPNEIFVSIYKISNFFSGLLDRPSLPSSIEEVSYKLHITGRSCVGKTATVARLSGIKYPSIYVETAGIRKSNIFWPVKIWDKIILFKLQFWDAGDNSIKRYSHILPVCQRIRFKILLIFYIIR